VRATFVFVRHGDEGRTTTTRAVSLILLAVHLVVILLGGALLGEARTRPAGRGALALAVATAQAGFGGDGLSIASSSDPRMDRATRPRGDRGERGSGSPPLDALVPSAVPSMGPPSLAVSFAAGPTARVGGRSPSVINGPRGPPRAG
jgi:hypothetical protein